MTVQLSPIPLDSFALIKEAAIAYHLGQSRRPSAVEVVEALLNLEAAATAQRIRYFFSELEQMNLHRLHLTLIDVKLYVKCRSSLK